MARARIAPGTVGPVGVVPIGTVAGDEVSKERVIPAPRTDGGDSLPYPKGWQVGKVYKVPTDNGVIEFLLTSWRGLARAVDQDGNQYQVRRWRDTKAAAIAATEQAAARKLERLAADRQAKAIAATAAAQLEADGDTTTTVADLVNRWLAGPKMAHGRNMSDKTQQDYRYAAAYILDSQLATLRPGRVSVQQVKDFLAVAAQAHGKGGAKHARAVLSHALDIAVDSSGNGGPTDMHTPRNPTILAKRAIPDVVTRPTGLDHQRTTTGSETFWLLWRLYHDPEALPMTVRRRGRKGEHAAVPNGKDVADLATWLFNTGTRLGEALAVRWSDLNLDSSAPTASISGTVTFTVGVGVQRQDRTKSSAGQRIVPLHSRMVAMLRRRARTFGIDLDSPPTTPVFGSPQFPDRFRDPNNLNKVIRRLYNRWGVSFGRSHLGRKFRVTSLAAKGVPLRAIADMVGHSQTATTVGYLSRSADDDAKLRGAL